MSRNPKAVIAIGPLRPGGVGKHWVQPAMDLPIPTRVCASTQPNMTLEDVAKLPKPYLRPGSCHKHIPSRGVGC